jgi:hypothetical protein
MRNLNSYLHLVTAANLFSSSGILCLKDSVFVTLYMSGGVDRSLRFYGISPLTKDSVSEEYLYSFQDLPEVINIYGPMYLNYLKQRSCDISSMLEERAHRRLEVNELINRLKEPIELSVLRG